MYGRKVREELTSHVRVPILQDCPDVFEEKGHPWIGRVHRRGW